MLQTRTLAVIRRRRAVSGARSHFAGKQLRKLLSGRPKQRG